MRLLIVEDNDLLGDGLQAGLRGMGLAADWVRDGEAAWLALSTEPFVAVVLDLGLPRLSGIELLKRLRSSGDATPVLILTARDAVADRIAGLDSGADDYLVKPCDLGELAARLRALIRRADGHARPTLTVGPLEIDPAAHTVRYHDEFIELSVREFALLQELARESGRVISREQLAERLYPWGSEIESNSIDIHIHHLRKKITPSVVVTLRGVGYMLPSSLS